MTQVLGYRSFGVQGGDWGSIIASRVGHAYPKSVIGVHLNMVALGPPEGRKALGSGEEAKRFLDGAKKFQSNESGYQQIQGTKPQTLAYGLNDSPAGLAAWIVEKFRTWSDCGGDVESRFIKDQLLTNITMLTGSRRASIHPPACTTRSDTALIVWPPASASRRPPASRCFPAR